MIIETNFYEIYKRYNVIKHIGWKLGFSRFSYPGAILNIVCIVSCLHELWHLQIYVIKLTKQLAV